MAGKHIQKNTPVRPERTARYAAAPERGSVYEKAPYAVSRVGTKKRGSNGMKVLIPVMLVLIFVVAGLAGLMVQAKRVDADGCIYPNITVNGVDVGGMTVEEAAEALDINGANPYKGQSLTINFPLDRTLTVTMEELGLGGGAESAAEAAYAYGRGGSLIENLRTYRACKKITTELGWDVTAQPDETLLSDKITETADEINNELLQSEAEIGEDGITLTKGMSTACVEPEPVLERAKQAIRDRDFTDIEVEFTETGASAEDTVLQTVYDTIFVEPVNAMYDTETGGATESVRGVSFDMEAAQKLWDAAETGEKVFIPFVFTEPEIDAETLMSRLFADCLSEKTTSLSGSSSNRINNVTLAAQSLNGTVLNPGETFDYNSCLGQRTEEKGYKEAGAYANGQHVMNVGGGICQASSTLYYCALYANLQITVRDNHYFVISYLPWGLDATVSWGGPDFRFINSRDYPIEIKAWVSNGSLTVQIWGTDVDGSYVSITSDTWEDSEHYYAQTYRTVYAADGTVLSSEKEAYSRYFKYEAGEETPAPEAETATPKPTSTPEPTAAPTPEPTAPPATEPPATATPAPTEPPVTEAPVTPEPPPEPTPEPTQEPEPVTPEPEPESEDEPDTEE